MSIYRFVGGIREKKYHTFCKEEDLYKYIAKYGQPGFSIESFEGDDLKEQKYRESTLHIDFTFDIDNENDVEKSLKDARILYGYLTSELKLKSEEIFVCFSGCKGFSVSVYSMVIGNVFESMNRMGDLCLSIADKLGIGICKDIYKKRNLLRVPNTLNIPKQQGSSQPGKPSLYKIALTQDELFSLSLDEIRELAKNQREHTSPSKQFNPEASEILKQMLQDTPRRKKEKKTTKTLRNNTILRLENVESNPLYQFLLPRVRNPGCGQSEWLSCSCDSPIHTNNDNTASAGFNLETGVFNCIRCGSKSFFQYAKEKDWDIPQDVIDYLLPQEDILPSGILTAIYQYDMEKLGLETYTPDEVVPDQDIYNQLTDRFSQIIPRSGVPEETRDGLLANVQAMAKGLMRANNEIIIFPMHPGLFKTLLLQYYVSIRAKKDSNYGAVIVSERNKDVIKNAEFINSYIGQEVAYPMLGYDHGNCRALCYHSCKTKECPTGCQKRKGYKDYDLEQCRNCTVWDCRVKQNYINAPNYRILCITHKRLSIFGIAGLEKFKIEGKEYTREDLFIDEVPKLVEISQISTDEIMGFMNNCQAHKILSKKMDQIREKLRETVLGESGKIDAISRVFHFDNNFKMKYLNRYPTEKLKLDTLEALICRGGIRSEKEGITSFHCSHILDLNNIKIRTTILDGTAIYDQRYKMLKCRYLKLPWKPRYDNVRLIISKNKNLSKTFLAEKGKLTEVLPYIKDIIESTAGMVYVVTFEKCEDEIKKYLEASKLADRVILQHYNNTRGSNAMIKCSTMILVGTLRKPPEYYYTMTRSITGGSDNLNLGVYMSQKDKTLRFCHKDTEFFRIMDTLQELIQEIHRISIRRHRGEPARIYYFNHDSVLTDLLTHALPGCQVVSERLINPHIFKFKEVIRDFVASGADSITKSEILAKMGIKKREKLGEVLEMEHIRTYLYKLGIIIGRYMIRKAQL